MLYRLFFALSLLISIFRCDATQLYRGAEVQKLENDISVMFIDTSKSENILVMLCLSVGSTDEFGTDGVANLLANIFSKQLNRNAETMHYGCQSTLYSGYDQSIHYVYGKQENLEGIIKNFGTVYSNFELTEPDINACKQEIVQKIASDNQIDKNIANQEAMKCMYWHTKYGTTIIGNMNVASIDPEDLVKFRDRFYRNSRLLIIVAGNVNKQETINLINKYFIKKDVGEDKIERLQEPSHHDATVRLTSNSSQVSVPMIDFYWEIPNYRNNSNEAFATEIFINALDDILQGIISEGIKNAASVEFSYSFWNYDYGTFRMSITANDDSKVDELITSIITMIRCIAADGITQAQVDAAMKKISSSASLIDRDVIDVVSIISMRVSAGNNFEFVKSYNDFVKKGCELKLINSQAKKIFQKQPRVISVIYPEKKRPKKIEESVAVVAPSSEKIAEPAAAPAT